MWPATPRRPRSASFEIVSCAPAPALAFRGALAASPYAMAADDTLAIRFDWRSCAGFVRDESVLIVVTDTSAPDYPLVAWVYSWDIVIDEGAGEYRQDFRPALYGAAPGSTLTVAVYFGSELAGTATVTLTP